MSMNQDDKNSEAQMRENPEPHETARPVPRLVIGIAALAVIWSIAYIVMSNPASDSELGDSRTRADLMADAGGASSGMADGAQIFAAQCAACHQATGLGLPGVFPPLAGSEWVLGKEALAVNILLHGVTGKLTVKETAYNGAMPAYKDKLNDEQVAAVLTYVRSNFGNGAVKIDAALVKREREASKDRTTSWNGDADLLKLKE
jgi:mono/diheme cytochrome c family protein